MPAGEDILYRCNITWYMHGQNCINSFFFRSKETSPYPTVIDEMNALHDSIRNWIISPFRLIMSSDVLLVSSVLQALNGGALLVDVRNYVGLFGQTDVPALPSMCAMVTSWRTRYSGRRTHGRTYWPGIPNTRYHQSRLTNEGQVALFDQSTGVLNKFGLTGSESSAWMVVFSRKNGTTRLPGPPPTISYSSLAGVPIERVVADSVIYTQRHRLTDRGI